jgi:serine protease inhibitor ecotin
MVLTVGVPNGSYLFMEKHVFIRVYLSNVRVIMAIICGSIALSDNDGMTYSTQVPVVRCTWAHVVVSYRVWH